MTRPSLRQTDRWARSPIVRRSMDDTGPVWIESTGTYPAVRAAGHRGHRRLEDLPHRDPRGRCPAGGLLHDRRRRVRGRHGPLGFGQVDPHAHPRVPGRPHVGLVPPGRRRRQHHDRGGAGPRAQQAHRLRLPAVQPAGVAVGLAQRGAPPPLRRRRPGRAQAPGPRLPGPGGPGRPGRPPPGRAVRRPAAAGGHGPGPGHRPRPDPGRRAHRQPGLGVGRAT